MNAIMRLGVLSYNYSYQTLMVHFIKNPLFENNNMVSIISVEY